MKIGYVRISKQEQYEALQVDALKEAGCEKSFLDTLNKAHPALADDRSWLVWGCMQGHLCPPPGRQPAPTSCCPAALM